MSCRNAVLTVISLAALVLFATGFIASESDCNCPKEDFTKHGDYRVLIDKELSTAEAIPTAGPFGFAKSMTVCMKYDQANTSYPQNVNLQVEGSIDGKNWYWSTIAGTTTLAQLNNGCLAVTPTRYVRVGWGPVANIQAPGPRVTASVQVGY